MDDEALRRFGYSENLAWSKLAEGAAGEARGLFLDCLGLADGDLGTRVGDVYVGLGQCLLEEGNSPDALRYFALSLATGPSAHLRPIARRYLAELDARKYSR